VAEHASRRRFLADLLRSAARVAEEVRESTSGAFDETGQTPAAPTTRLAVPEELPELVSEFALGRRLDAIRQLALPSVRLCPTGRVAAEPEPIVRVALDEAAAILGATALPEGDSLRVRWSEAGCRADVAEVDGRSCVAGHEVELSGELTLPSAWSNYVRPLALTPVEQVRWEELRKRLAAAQGVEIDEYTERPQSIHRLLGYADETLSELQPPWRLLVQLTLDPRLGLDFGEGASRLYVWVRGSDLSTACAVRR